MQNGSKRKDYFLALALGGILFFLPVVWQFVVTILLFSLYAVLPQYCRRVLVVSLWLSLPLAAYAVYAKQVTKEYRGACALPWGEKKARDPLPIPIFKPRASGTCVRPYLFNYLYAMDKFGRRGNGDEVVPAKGAQIVISTGGSIVFGQGVADTETFSAQLERRTRGKYRVINLGIPGGGFPHVIAEILNLEELVPEIKGQNDPVLLFTMSPKQLAKFDYAGAWYWRNFNPSFNPVYHKEGDTLLYLGDHNNRIWPRYFKLKLGEVPYKYLVGNIIAAAEEKSALREVPDDEIQDYAEALNMLAEVFFKKYPRGRVILNHWHVDFMPQGDQKRVAITKLNYLLDAKIEVSEMPDAYRLPKFGSSKRPDYHPQAEAHAAMAKHLAKVLRRK